MRPRRATRNSQPQAGEACAAKGGAGHIQCTDRPAHFPPADPSLPGALQLHELSIADVALLRRLKDGPVWLRSFQPMKWRLDLLIECGFVERCRPPLGRCANMARLTDRGAAEIGFELPLSLMDQFAERLAEHGSIADAAKECGATHAYGKEMFGRICERLGAQAV